MEEEVILVDADDHAIGVAPKQTAHERGLLHRAFSIVLVDEQGRVLLQRRAHDKYHSGGLWANSCCGHPRPGESTSDAAARRIHEELGIVVRLRHVGTVTYRAVVSDTMIEHEVDHVFTATTVGELAPDPHEIAEIAWVAPDDLFSDLQRRPERYAAWVKHIIRIWREMPNGAESQTARNPKRRGIPNGAKSQTAQNPKQR